MRRWVLVVSSAYRRGEGVSRRFWTEAGARRHAELLRVLGPDFHFRFTLADRRTGAEVEV